MSFLEKYGWILCAMAVFQMTIFFYDLFFSVINDCIIFFYHVCIATNAFGVVNHFNAIYTVWMNRYSSAAPIFIITVSNSGRLSSSTIFFYSKTNEK